MSKVRVTVMIGLLGVVLLVMLVFFGCDNKLKGTERANRPPIIKFSNIPPDSASFSLNPEISWYAIDIDGYVTKYQYAVIIADSLHVVGKLWQGDGTPLIAVDSVCSVLARIPPGVWVDSLQGLDPAISFISAVDTTTSIVKVRLFAKESPNDTITQHLFVRAIDNDTAISNIIHRVFNRNNHKPRAHINYAPFRSGNTVRSVYCLPETTETWKGIKITWEGSDSDDYKGTQPEFLYKWELWGPFETAETTSINPTNTARLVDFSLSEDSLSHYVEDKSLLLPKDNKFLVNYPHIVPDTTYSEPDSGFGWYLFKVWTMDDAFTLSDPPGHLWFRIIRPLLTYQPIKKVLILDFTDYTSGGSDIDSLNAENFYEGAFNYVVSKHLCDSYSFKTYSEVDTLTTRDILSRYNLIVYLNEGAPSSLGGAIDPYFIEYMQVGGRMWAIGNSSATFGSPSFNSTITALDSVSSWPIYNASSNIIDFITIYFDLLGVYNKMWATAFGGQEFIGAEPYRPLDNPEIQNLPRLEVDTLKVKNQIYWGGGGYKPPMGLPFASYAWLGRNATRIYTFVSFYSDGSNMNNKPCGSVCKGPIGPDGNPIKTAYLSFGLHFIKDVNGAKRDSLFEGIVGWLLED
jgi:hypothetical protein